MLTFFSSLRLFSEEQRRGSPATGGRAQCHRGGLHAEEALAPAPQGKATRCQGARVQAPPVPAAHGGQTHVPALLPQEPVRAADPATALRAGVAASLPAAHATPAAAVHDHAASTQGLEVRVRSGFWPNGAQSGYTVAGAALNFA